MTKGLKGGGRWEEEKATCGVFFVKGNGHWLLERDFITREKGGGLWKSRDFLKTGGREDAMNRRKERTGGGKGWVGRALAGVRPT